MMSDDDDCLHCTIAELCEEWLDRKPPEHVILRVAQVLGGLLGMIIPEDRERALKDVVDIIRQAARGVDESLEEDSPGSTAVH